MLLLVLLMLLLPASCAETDAVNGSVNQTILLVAVVEGRVGTVQRMIGNGADVNAKGMTGRWSPLHLAVMGNDLKMARMLLQNKALVNVMDEWGKSPLHYASGFGYVKMARLLLQNDANVNATDEWDSTPIHYAAMEGHGNMTLLLLKRGAYVDARDDWGGRTPLLVAAMRGHARTVRVLLDNGADPNARARDDRTPMHWAVTMNHVEVALILEAKAKDGTRSASECHPSSNSCSNRAVKRRPAKPIMLEP